MNSPVNQNGGSAGVQGAGVNPIPLRPLVDAARLYVAWAKRTGDYPHDEDGCMAHDALIDAVEQLEQFLSSSSMRPYPPPEDSQGVEGV